jgi:hypothetical protein
VLRDALAHLVVEGFRRGDVGAEAAVLAGKTQIKQRDIGGADMRIASSRYAAS